MVKDLLISYYKSTGSKKPKRLLFYRDGVSEGQFAEVSRTEIPQVPCFPNSHLELQAGNSHCSLVVHELLASMAFRT